MSMVGVLVLAAAMAMQSGSWSYRLEWEHDGAQLTHFELCVDGECARVEATRVEGNTWSTAVPLLSQGLHTLGVNACYNRACMSGIPTVSVNVTPGPSINPPSQPNPPGQPDPPSPPSQPNPPAPGGKAPPRRPPKV